MYLFGLFLGLLACGHDTTGPAPLGPAQLFWTLDLNHSGVTLSTIPPYDTVHLVVTPRTVTGAPLIGPMTVQYRVVGNDTSVFVSPTGLVTAHAPNFGTPTQVTVAATVGTVTFTRTAFIAVDTTAQPPVLSHLTFQVQNPNRPDFHQKPQGVTRLDCSPMHNYGLSLTATAVDAQGNPIPGAQFYYTSSHPEILPIDSLTGNLITTDSRFPWCSNGQRGPVTIYATTTAYGVSRTDSVQFRMIPPLLKEVAVLSRVPAATLTPELYFAPATDTVGVGGVVMWANLSTADSVDVVFDAPPAPVLGGDATSLLGFWGYLPVPAEAGGDVAPFLADTLANPVEKYVGGLRARRFSAVGTYHYHNSRYHTTGIIVVQDTL